MEKYGSEYGCRQKSGKNKLKFGACGEFGECGKSGEYGKFGEEGKNSGLTLQLYFIIIHEKGVMINCFHVVNMYIHMYICTHLPITLLTEIFFNCSLK